MRWWLFSKWALMKDRGSLKAVVQCERCLQMFYHNSLSKNKLQGLYTQLLNLKNKVPGLSIVLEETFEPWIFFLEAFDSNKSLSNLYRYLTVTEKNKEYFLQRTCKKTKTKSSISIGRFIKFSITNWPKFCVFCLFPSQTTRTLRKFDYR